MSFSDIKGQDRALGILTQGIHTGHIFSSYLFIGPDGIGKRKTAENFAKALNCLADGEKPCDECISCKKADSRIHPDVFCIEPRGPSASLGIDQIRSVIRHTSLKPYEGRKKVFIIDKAHTMNDEAANAFLKTLEEPPEDTVLILISRSKELLLSTIVSRCHTVKFTTAPTELIKGTLIDRFDIPAGEAKMLSNFSFGRIGEAVRIKEKGLLDRKNRIIECLRKGSGDIAREIGTYADREELKENCSFLISFFRDVFLYRALRDESAVYHSDRTADIRYFSNRVSSDELNTLLQRIIELSSYIDYNVNPKIIVDVLCSEVRKISAVSGI